MKDLATLRKYSEILGKASKWINSKDAILNIENSASEKKKSECVFEFYCALKILVDLSKNYEIRIVNNNKKYQNIFPKSPSEKRNFPYFLVLDKVTGAKLFQVCLGTKITGETDEKSAPDISIQRPDSNLRPTYNDVEIIYDAKFKHGLNAKVTDGEFAKLYFMVTNLKCENADSNVLGLQFDSLKDFIGNCLISNGQPYKTTAKIHQMRKIKEIVNFGESSTFKVYG